MITEIIVGFFLLLVIYFLNIHRIPEGMPPGLWGWPLLGVIPSRDIPICKQAENYVQKFGKIFTWKIGNEIFVFLSDYNLIKEAYNNPLICDRPPIFSLMFFSDFNYSGVIVNHGTGWSNIRRFTLRYLKDHGMGKSSIEDCIKYEAECLVKDFRTHTNKPTEIPWSVNVAVINTLWKILADIRFDVEDKVIQEFERFMTDLVKTMQSPYFFIFNYLPWIAPLIPEFLKRNFFFKSAMKEMEAYRSFFRKAIMDHKEAYNDGDQKDFIDAFLAEMKLTEQGKGSGRTNNFTEKELLYTLSDLFTAGSETTSSSMRWLILCMAQYQDIQKKVQEEIDNNVPRDRLPTLSDRENLPYLDAVIHEVMRHKTMAPIGVFHSVSRDTFIGKYKIPKGTFVVSNIAACHADPDYWKKPTEFIPERFLNPNGSFNSEKESFLPFSIGRRVCPGESLARMELYLFFGALMQNFTFESENELHIESGATADLLSVPEPANIIILER